MDQQNRAERAGGGADDFVFDERAPHRRVIDRAILDAIRRYAPRRRGKLLTLEGFSRWKGRPCSAQTVRARFGSWREALRRAGVRARVKVHLWTPEELMDSLESLWRTNAKPPTWRDLARIQLSQEPYRRVWGSLPAARTLLARYKRGEITREDLLRPINPAPTSRPPIPAGMRYEVLQRDGFRCVKCGRGPHSDPPVELEADHIRPHAKGGKTRKENLQTLCRDCNRGKGDRE